ncbi:hypothetical protein [Algibacillus agarilyticus]|uniref:hypothetical protein n=1 Tax=Algibacillus agarilyticus TaxID=2234133 RepID=UPI000DCFF981|nr:hypothetical protein [Algibacillus agarilyticus]
MDYAQNKFSKRFVKKFMLSMVIFLILIAVQTFAFELYELSMLLKVFFALLPVVPLIWSFFIYREYYLTMDEYLQRLTGESLIWITGLVGFSTFAYGMLAMKMPMPEFNIAFLLPIIFGCHGVIVQILVAVDARAE